MRPGIKLPLFAGLTLLVLITGAVCGYWLIHDLPTPDVHPQRLQLPSIRIVDRNNRLLYELLDPEGGRHAVVQLGQIPIQCRQATVATEDHSFYTNPGIDLRGILRAIWINLRGGETLSGGSTITQQVARNLLLEAGERGERSVRRKLRESLLAAQLTQRFSKDEILALYLNQTYYGGMAYGIEAAAQTFFGKSVSRLDLAECALLAGLPQSPARYNPFTDYDSSKARQKIVLGLMASAGDITVEQQEQAEKEPLVLAESPYPIEAPHFVMMVRNQIDALFQPEEIREAGGLVVVTSLDLDWQHHAEKAIRFQLMELSRSPEDLGHNIHNAALVALDPQNGDVLALVGSPDYFDEKNSGAVNMAVSPRQPGSALKPLVYAAALDPTSPKGGWTAGTMLLDVRTSFETSDGKAYTPANYDLKEHGPVLLREALASSLNIPAVLTLGHIGLPELINISHRLGITSLGDPLDYDLSLALGGGAVRLVELSAAYGAFANGGYRVEPRLILEIRNLQNDLIYQAPVQVKQRVLDEKVAWLINDILSDRDARRLGFGSNSLLNLDRPAAVKTGTTSNFHDNWTVGYTPDLVVGVWSGNTNYEPMRDVNGLSGAAPIWHQFMRTVLSVQPEQDFQRPSGLVQVEVCALSGLLPTEACTYRKLEWFIEGTQPDRVDSLYRKVYVDSTSGGLADENTIPAQRMPKVVLDLPPQALPWARQAGLPLYSDYLNQSQRTSNNMPVQAFSTPDLDSRTNQLEIVSPAFGSRFYKAKYFDSQAQRIRLEAITGMELDKLSFWVDGKQIVYLESSPYQVWWTLEIGEHRVWAEATSPEGEKLVSPVVTFTVYE